MTPEVIYAPEAERDLLEIWLYIGADNPHAADRMIDRLHATANGLSEYPEMGRQDEERAGRRIFVVGNYLIMYRPTENGIVVLRCVHGRRDLRNIV